MVKASLLHYENPVDKKTNKKYFVPCVHKNKDTLVYYIKGAEFTFYSMVRNLNVDGAKTLKFPLDITSLRFTDILPDGKHLNKLTDAEIERESTPSKPERNHPDNNIKSDKSDVRFLELNCSGCGNNYIFKHPREIPGVNLNCGLCDRILIHYTGHEDWEYEFYDK